MTKILLNSFLIALALGTGSVASAETAVTTSVNATTSTAKPRILQNIKETRQDAREDIKDIRQNLASTTREAKSDIKDIRQNTASSTREMRGEIKENAQARIENRYEKMIDRFQKTIERETIIMTKINARIVKIKELGGNTTEAETLTANAKVELDEAGAGLITLKSLVEVAITQENSGKPGESMAVMRTTAKEIEKNLREAHRNLLKSVGVLRGVSQLRNASSTTSIKAETN